MSSKMELFVECAKELYPDQVDKIRFPEGDFDFAYGNFHWPNIEVPVKKPTRHNKTGRIIAVKFISLQRTLDSITLSPANKKNIVEEKLREIHLHRILSNSINVVDFYGFAFHGKCLLSFMELMDMSLRDFYQKVHGRMRKFPENFLGYIAVQIINGLTFCKEKNVIHRDLKPHNILVNSSGEIKLADFGSSRFLADSLASTFVGTVAYWPPERFAGRATNTFDSYDVRADVWSLGITLCEVVYNGIAYGETSTEFSDDFTAEKNLVRIQNLVSVADTNSVKIVDRCFKSNTNQQYRAINHRTDFKNS